MDFTNSFSVKAPFDQVWHILQDVHAVAPCVPGTSITEEIDPTHFRGTIKVKLGPIQMSFRGDLEMTPDDANHTIVIRARGSELRGVGGASGTITTRLTPEDGATHVEIDSRIDVSGRIAQFGRGIIQDVAGRNIKAFAACLEQKLGEGK